MKNRENRRAITRSQGGLTIVEALVAILIGSIISGAMLDLLSQLQRVSSSSQNELCANAIAQEIMDTARSLDYDYLASPTRIGVTFSLLPNRVAVGQNGPDIHTEPVLLDLANKVWDPKVLTSKFPGTVELKVEPSSIPNAVKVTSIVSWSDSLKIGKTGVVGRTVTTSTTVMKTGLNLWKP